MGIKTTGLQPPEVEHGDRLDRLVRSVSAVRAPTLIRLQNSLIRLFSGLIFYLLLPLAMLLFAWKAAVFPAWEWGLFGVAVAVIASHVMLPFSRLSWRSKGLLSVSVSAAIIAGGVMLGFGPLRRPFYLHHANLSGQWLVSEDLREANLNFTNLSHADLTSADLSDADLHAANLSGANLRDANLRDADLSAANLHGANLSFSEMNNARLFAANLSGTRLWSANLSGAQLSGVDLSDADLHGANLSFSEMSGARLWGANLNGANLTVADLSAANLHGATNLTQTQLGEACGTAYTKLPEGFTLKPCSW